MSAATRRLGTADSHNDPSAIRTEVGPEPAATASREATEPAAPPTAIEPTSRLASLIRGMQPALLAVEEDLEIVERMRTKHPWVGPTLGRWWNRAAWSLRALALFLLGNSVAGQDNHPSGGQDRGIGATLTALGEHWQTWAIGAVLIQIVCSLIWRNKRKKKREVE